MISETVKQRAINEDELAYLEMLLASVLNPRKRLLKTILNLLVVWSFSLIGFTIAWFIASFALQQGWQIDISVTSSAGVYIKWAGIIFSGLYAIYSTTRWLAELPNQYALITQDLQQATVNEQTFKVSDVVRFQEPELGGYIYFLQIEQKVLVLYDYQSQEEGESSDFVVKGNIHRGQAPESGFYFEPQFSGETVNVSASYKLTLKPEEWPEPDSWCKTPWHELKAKYAS